MGIIQFIICLLLPSDDSFLNFNFQHSFPMGTQTGYREVDHRDERDRNVEIISISSTLLSMIIRPLLMQECNLWFVAVNREGRSVGLGRLFHAGFSLICIPCLKLFFFPFPIRINRETVM